MRAVLPAAAILLVVAAARADDAGATRGGDAGLARDKVIAVVGVPPASQSVTAGELHDRVAAMPSFERATFATTADGVRRAVLDRVLVRDALLALGAQAEGVEKQPAAAAAIDRAAANATVRAIAARLPAASEIPMADVRAYYDAHVDHYVVPARIRLWRILCATKQDADAVLAAAQADSTPKAFAQLARDHSQDKATAMRSGDLGFLTAAGDSSEPGLRVDPAIVAAAQDVRDGEFVRAPVAEGAGVAAEGADASADGGAARYYAVIWRRGSTAAVKRTVDEAAPSIRDLLQRQRVKEETEKLVASLRAAKVRDLHPDALDTLDVPEPDASR